MKLIPEVNNLKEYLAPSQVIDYNIENIQNIAKKSAANIENDDIHLAKTVYEYVRDEISHSFDINSDTVTCNASDVLKYKQGICYAKSHLLAAILRYLGIPTGLCYQKLIVDDTDKPWFSLHGLNAIYLKSLNKWIRVDARGNKKGVAAEFSIDTEMLAYTVREELGERDYPTIYAKANKNVIKALKHSNSREDLIKNLPPEL